MKKTDSGRDSFTTIYTQAHKEIVRRLVAARHASGLRQADAAKKLHRPIWYVQKCESGQRKIDLIELFRFAMLYGKPIAYFTDDLPIQKTASRKSTNP